MRHKTIRLTITSLAATLGLALLLSGVAALTVGQGIGRHEAREIVRRVATDGRFEQLVLLHGGKLFATRGITRPWPDAGDDLKHWVYLRVGPGGVKVGDGVWLSVFRHEEGYHPPSGTFAFEYVGVTVHPGILTVVGIVLLIAVAAWARKNGHLRLPPHRGFSIVTTPRPSDAT